MNTPCKATSVTYSYSPPILSASDESSLAPSHYLAPPTYEECLFSRQGDYWVIRYQGQIAFLKTTRGLHYLSLLLRHPGREFHVSELAVPVGDASRLLRRASNVLQPCQVKRSSDLGPLLDAQARTEYKRRLDDLRSDLSRAERFDDIGRAEQARTEINAIAEQLASAVGLGGRDRTLSSEAERGRCAVTKRIKDAICKIGEAIPSLRRHLADQIKTGYFCSYNLSHERRVAWKFLLFLTVLCCEGESYIVT